MILIIQTLYLWACLLLKFVWGPFLSLTKTKWWKIGAPDMHVPSWKLQCDSSEKAEKELQAATWTSCAVQSRNVGTGWRDMHSGRKFVFRYRSYQTHWQRLTLQWRQGNWGTKPLKKLEGEGSSRTGLNTMEFLFHRWTEGKRGDGTRCRWVVIWRRKERDSLGKH